MKLRPYLLILSLTVLTGCTTQTKLAADLTAFEQLGITKLVITGKFSHTDYSVTIENGVRRAVINHTNVWVPQLQIVRETPTK